jgi:glycosyltransferase involved in cell wall biosynthesis
MKFLIITHVMHKRQGTQIGGYAPYVREMNLWLKHVNEVMIVAPLDEQATWNAIDLAYTHSNLRFVRVPAFSFTSLGEVLKSMWVLPVICFQILRAMSWASHIHLRCPGNMGLLGCLLQVFFPTKPKTVKYAGNWGSYAGEALTYRWQKRLLSNTWWTRRAQVLVYGEWPGQTTNIKSFFTATYHQNELEPLAEKPLQQPLQLVFVGTLEVGKRPEASIGTVALLREQSITAHLHLLGEGSMRTGLQQLIAEQDLGGQVFLHGNVSKDALKDYYRKAHFLVFLSRSEGWPKAVAEAMWWGCVPITTPVSCVPWMLAQGERGFLAEDATAAVRAIVQCLTEPESYTHKAAKAAEWSRQFTLENFEEAIVQIMYPHA